MGRRRRALQGVNLGEQTFHSGKQEKGRTLRTPLLYVQRVALISSTEITKVFLELRHSATYRRPQLSIGLFLGGKSVMQVLVSFAMLSCVNAEIVLAW
jgi:hypothetical protein